MTTLRLAVKAANLFIDLIEVIMTWWGSFQAPATEGGDSDSIDS